MPDLVNNQMPVPIIFFFQNEVPTTNEFRALKLYNLENLRALKLSDFESFRAPKASSLVRVFKAKINLAMGTLRLTFQTHISIGTIICCVPSILGIQIQILFSHKVSKWHQLQLYHLYPSDNCNPCCQLKRTLLHRLQEYL